MRLHGFQGLRYDRPAEEIDRLAAPPYDQIDAALRDRMHATADEQFTRLTCPAPAPGDAHYQAAADLHESWIESGVVRRDAEPSLYAYEIRLATGGRRLGVTGMVGIEPADSSVIRPHEATLEKPLADRLALLEAMRVDLEPVLLLSDDDGALDRLLAEDVGAGSPVAIHSDGDGHRHVLYRVSDPSRIEAYRSAVADCPAAIADGHHRYKTARRFAEKHDVGAGETASTKMAVITSLASSALTIDPIHRALTRDLDPAELGERATAEPTWASDGETLTAVTAGAQQPAIGLWRRGHDPVILKLDPASAPVGVPERSRDLAVALLHGSVLPAFGYAPESATDGTVLYRSDPQVLAAQLAAGDVEVGIWLPPMTPTAFSAAIAEGDLLPPKSTRFLPKVFSGLVWADHRSVLG